MSSTETSHFWVGRFTEEAAVGYFEEVRDPDDEDREHTPLSAFARDQGETWYDHDFLEHGCYPKAESVRELTNGHSYHEQWADELARRADAAGLTGMNFLIFISEGEVEEPRSVTGDGYELYYLGTIAYRV
ncbi:MAG: immunity 22 family protein [Gemmataceae bacterium]|nr:immunity 22 family protein [Gemmataceae bacterium]